MISVMDENWRIVTTLLPKYWENLARETGAVSQNLRGFHSIERLLDACRQGILISRDCCSG